MASAGDSVELTASGPTTRSVPTRFLAILAAVGILVGALGLVLPGVVGARDEFAKDRQDVATRASDFAVTFNTYTVKDKNQSSGDAKVLSVAVETIDKDSAVAIVAVNTSVRTSDSDESVARRFRWKINMRKLKDTWVVSVFDSVPTMEATVGDVTGKSKGGGTK